MSCIITQAVTHLWRDQASALKLGPRFITCKQCLTHCTQLLSSQFNAIWFYIHVPSLAGLIRYPRLCSWSWISGDTDICTHVACQSWKAIGNASNVGQARVSLESHQTASSTHRTAQVLHQLDVTPTLQQCNHHFCTGLGSTCWHAYICPRHESPPISPVQNPQIC